MRIYSNKYLSVTSIIDLKDPFDDTAFKKWCERNGHDYELVSATSRILGSKVSEYLDNKCKGLEWLSSPSTDALEERLYKAVDDFTKEWELLATEQFVKCEELNYAGRLDGIIRNKKTGQKILADWKTFGAWKDKPYKRDASKLKHTRWQTTLYMYASGLEQDSCAIVFKNDGTWELEPLKYDKDFIEWVKESQDLILQTIKENI